MTLRTLIESLQKAAAQVGPDREIRKLVCARDPRDILVVMHDGAAEVVAVMPVRRPVGVAK